MPAMFAILFIVVAEFTATLRLHSRNAAGVVTTVIHDSVNGVVSYELAGDASVHGIVVRDCETLVLLIRQGSHVVGSAVLEVNLALAGTHEAIFAPQSQVNAIIDQCEFDMIERGCQRGIEAAMGIGDAIAGREEVEV